MTLQDVLNGMLPECHLPRWIHPDTGACEHPDHDYDYDTVLDHQRMLDNYGGIY
ncbi:MAG: hypothetical protein LC650_00660 [Actinobacteria bacterium]|nr:hypothetical protein [Actinomycetota bacterium]